MRYIVWGTGAASAELIREADAADGVEYAIAYSIAAESVGTGGDRDATRWLAARAEDWCVSLEAEEDDVEAATRFDSAVLGYTALADELVARVTAAHPAGPDFEGLVRAVDAIREESRGKPGQAAGDEGRKGLTGHLR